jgi:hypothetical protein
MKRLNPGLALAMVLAGVMVCDSALARGHGGGGRSHGGHRGSHAHSAVIIGGGVFLPPVYGYGPYAPPVAMQPEWGYIEQGTDWYYCADSQKFFPDAQDCAGAWQLVTPPPGPPS